MFDAAPKGSCKHKAAEASEALLLPAPVNLDIGERYISTEICFVVCADYSGEACSDAGERAGNDAYDVAHLKAV